MIRLLNLFFVSILFIQHSAWASGLVLPYSPEIIESIIADYNSLSQTERAAQMKSYLEKHASDQQYFKSKNVDLLKVDWPELKLKDGVISFEKEGQTIKFETDKNMMLIRGERVQITPGKLGDAISKVEEILGKQETSFVDWIIPSAYAIGILAGILIALVAVAVWIYVLSPALNMISATASKIQCHKMKSEFANYDDSSLSESDANKIRSDANRVLSKTNSDLSKADCSKDPGICSALEASKKCYEFVLSQVEQSKNAAINTSEGSSWKDYIPWSRPAKVPGAVGR